MRVLPSVLEAIGNTPLIRLKAVSEATGCTILGKAEFLNPGQSVKDRAALWIIREAEKAGQLRPGGVIVEGTAGNTGIGLAVVGSALGYRTVIRDPRRRARRRRMPCACSVRSWSKCRPSLQEPEQLREDFRPTGGRARQDLSRTVPSGQINSTTSPTVTRTWNRQRRKSGAIPTARFTASSAPSALAVRLPGVAQGFACEEPGDQDRYCRSGRGSTLQLLCPWRTQGERQLDHGGHRQGRITRQSRRLHARFRLSDSRFRSRALRLRSH